MPAVYPTAAQVLNGVTFGPTGADYTGTVVLPTAAHVETGTSFGPSSGTAGTLVVPSTADVQSGVTFGAASALTGTFVSPATTDVRSGTLYGNSGEFVGNASNLTVDPGSAMSAPKSSLYTFLAGDTELAASVGTRIYEGISARGSAFPKITYRRISGAPIHYMGGASGVSHVVWQINCWSNVSNLAAEAVSELVRNRLDGYHGDMGDGYCQGCWLVDRPDKLYPPEDASSENVHCVSNQYEMFYAESPATG